MSAVMDSHGLAVELLGRSDRATRYYADEYERTSNEKAGQRRKVADFLLSHFRPNEIVYLLTLPGEFWFMEAYVLRQHRLAQIVGLERSETTFSRSLKCMPNAHDELLRRQVRFGSGTFEYACSPAMPHIHDRNTAHSHRHLRMSSQTYVGVRHDAYDANCGERKSFANKFYRRNAIWLDFTSGFCAGVDETVAGLTRVLHEHWPQCPVSLTFMYGRDIGGKELGRIDHLRRIQPAFLPQSYWIYAGKNGTPMMTVCGLLQNPRHVSPVLSETSP